MKKIFKGTKGKVIKGLLIGGGIIVAGAIIKSLTGQEEDDIDFDEEPEVDAIDTVTEIESVD